MNEYAELANAIIAQAATDYRNAREYIAGGETPVCRMGETAYRRDPRQGTRERNFNGGKGA